MQKRGKQGGPKSTRRLILGRGAGAAGTLAVGTLAAAALPANILAGQAATTPLPTKVDPAIRRELFQKAPGNGTAVMAFAYYARAKGLGMISIEQRWSRSDTIDVAYYRTSPDHGRTWSTPVERKTGERTDVGMLRRHLRGFWTDPNSGAAIELWNEGVLASDDPLEGLRQWQIHYAISFDGFRTRSGPVMVRQEGMPPGEPLPGVFLGKNSIMLGDQGSVPLAVRGGFLLPVEITPLAPDGKLFNPGGGYTYHDSAVLHARWVGRGKLQWRLSQLVKGDPARTTRGAIEPTLGRLADGRFLLVMRGSNDRKPALPSYRWVSFSDDAQTWSNPVPWTFTTGEPFFSPSSCSLLFRHSSRRLFWIGNLTPENAKGNRPRYPLWIGEVDLASGLLRKESLRIIDTLGDGEDPILSLSNFSAREDRVTKEIVVHCTRLFAKSEGWQGDSFAYHIPI